MKEGKANEQDSTFVDMDIEDAEKEMEVLMGKDGLDGARSIRRSGRVPKVSKKPKGMVDSDSLPAEMLEHSEEDFLLLKKSDYEKNEIATDIGER